MSEVQSSVGWLFHARDPCMVKLRSPQFILVCGTVSWPECAAWQWRLMTDDSGWQYSWRLSRAMLLCIKTAVLNTIDCRISSQWRSHRTSYQRLCIWTITLHVLIIFWRHICLVEAAVLGDYLFLGAMYNFFTYLLNYFRKNNSV